MPENTLLPRFLFDPAYRLGRHLLLIAAGALITFNQAFVAYLDCLAQLGGRIYLIGLACSLVYLAALYVNYFYLTPRFLLQGRYLAYGLLLGTLAFSLPALSLGLEYAVREAAALPHRVTSYANPLILVDNLSASVITAICLGGISAGTWFRHGLAVRAQVVRLEEEHLQTELNELKGQITPSFLSRTLRHAAALAETNPAQTTRMLMELSHLLRYQLYDCRRDKILLQAEIGFLARFLDLEQLNNPRFRYRLHTGPGLDRLFVSPLLFISFVQYALPCDTPLTLAFSLAGDGCLCFRCRSDRATAWADEAESRLTKRLQLQYPGRHVLVRSSGEVEVKLQLTEPA